MIGKSLRSRKFLHCLSPPTLCSGKFGVGNSFKVEVSILVDVWFISCMLGTSELYFIDVVGLMMLGSKLTYSS